MILYWHHDLWFGGMSRCLMVKFILVDRMALLIDSINFETNMKKLENNDTRAILLSTQQEAKCLHDIYVYFF